MAPKSSIFITITFIFILALTSIGLAFIWLMDFDKQNYTRELNAKYSNVARANLFFMSGIIGKDEYDRQTEGVKMPKVTSASIRNNILNKGSIIEQIETDLGTSAIILYDKRNYLKIQHVDEILLLVDKEFQPYRYYVIKGIFALVTLTLLGAYIFIIYKIKPLRKLKRQIDKFALGNIDDITNVSVGNDEISEVSEAFYNAVCQIKTLNSSRQLFLRNIMHELKTPITKGLIAAQMIPEGKNQQRIISLFHRLEGLINELAAIEQTTSNISPSNRILCKIEDILDEARELALLEEEQISLHILDNRGLIVDFRLFATAVKNMLDNAIKYSPDKKVQIYVEKEKISFLSKGEKINIDLNLLTQPFIKGENAKQSFGLGLYIVSSILKSHGLTLQYEYKDGINIFKFENINILRE